MSVEQITAVGVPEEKISQAEGVVSGLEELNEKVRGMFERVEAAGEMDVDEDETEQEMTGVMEAEEQADFPQEEEELKDKVNGAENPPVAAAQAEILTAAEKAGQEGIQEIENELGPVEIVASPGEPEKPPVDPEPVATREMREKIPNALRKKIDVVGPTDVKVVKVPLAENDDVIAAMEETPISAESVMESGETTSLEETSVASSLEKEETVPAMTTAEAVTEEPPTVEESPTKEEQTTAVEVSAESSVPEETLKPGFNLENDEKIEAEKPEPIGNNVVDFYEAARKILAAAKKMKEVNQSLVDLHRREDKIGKAA